MVAIFRVNFLTIFLLQDQVKNLILQVVVCRRHLRCRCGRLSAEVLTTVFKIERKIDYTKVRVHIQCSTLQKELILCSKFFILPGHLCQNRYCVANCWDWNGLPHSCNARFKKLGAYVTWVIRFQQVMTSFCTEGRRKLSFLTLILYDLI